ncbi:endophilin-B2-like isoform X2 [Dinothrombium tinctorium]|uniref:Endophilin-B2-like isoform X2 n=1 Tax=Dinothrombium tinctorium TaxID=1965070 RepID=A0A3S3PEC3_9ACAR|nr:endophilin-B2-like isoform X2 [Dinothrombium tinctorium]
MEFSVKTIKGFAAEAATALSRAVQYTEEKLGTSEKTELDAHFESLCESCDKTRFWTEKIVSKTESVLQPNPNTRVEDYLFEKFDKKKDRLSNLENLGKDMIDAGLHFGPGTVYGSALIKVGQTQQKLGKAEREFVTKSYKSFVHPLRKFLDEDVRTVLKERKVLEAKRLDLDAAKNRLRKARTAESQENAKPELIAKEIDQAEEDLKSTQEGFNRQVEITKILLEGLNSAQTNHVRCLSEFVESQIEYYANCHNFMCELQRELACVSLSTVSGGIHRKSQVQANDICSPTDELKLPNGRKRARVLYDYDAHDSSELSLMANEVIIVSQSPELDADWMLGERGTQRGKVPIAYLEILS